MNIELTREDIKAMRAANRYSVTINGDGVRIGLVKEIRRRTNDGFGDERNELRREFNANGGLHQAVAGFYAHFPSGAWQALCAIVRPGDSLHFHARTNGNGYLDAAVIPAGKLEHHTFGYSELFNDELCVSIMRKAKTIVRDMVLAHSICPDNSARAIRRAEYQIA
jgi:hypothetical protein